MGLDVTALRQISKTTVPEGADPYDNGAHILYTNPDFPGRADGIEDGAYHAVETFGFRAGSYGGYNDWREQLAKFAGYADGGGDDRHRHGNGAMEAGAGPFYEMIAFSDCEGAIGATVSAKLAKDFAEFQSKADAFDGPEASWFKAKYADWRRAFEMAADGGAVMFH